MCTNTRDAAHWKGREIGIRDNQGWIVLDSY